MHIVFNEQCIPCLHIQCILNYMVHLLPSKYRIFFKDAIVICSALWLDSQYTKYHSSYHCPPSSSLLHSLQTPLVF